MSLPNFEDVYKAREIIEKAIKKTPFEVNQRLSKDLDAQIFFKREDLQEIRSFKIRGAYHKISLLTPEQRNKGIICSSAGNHAQGVAYACNQLKINGVIYMPKPTPKQKIDKVKIFGESFVKIVLEGDTYNDAQDIALQEVEKSGKIFIHPFDDEKVIEGQATLALEILEQKKENLDYLFVPIGGGGLISGILTVFKELSPNTKIIGLEPEGAASMKKSLEHKRKESLELIDTFADGVAVKQVGDISFNLCNKYLKSSDILTIPEGKICQAILDLYTMEGIIVEPAGAIGVAALDLYKDEIKGKKVGVIICGGNNDITRMAEIQERALLYRKLKHYFIVHFPQRAGALKEFVTTILGPTDDITFFEYSKKNLRENAPAVVGIELKKEEDFDSLISRMKEAGFYGDYLNDKPDLFQHLI